MTKKINLNGSVLFKAASAINKICKPLSSILDIPLFCFNKIYNDGSRIILCNLPHVISYFFEENQYMNTWYFNGAPASAYSSRKNSWVSERNTLSEKQSILDNELKKHFNLHEGIDYVERKNNCVEIFSFAAKTQHLYKLHDNTLKHFNFVFKEQARSLILDAENEKINLSSSNSSSLPKELTYIESEFKDKTPIKRYYLSGTSDIYLTAREIDCLEWCAKGKTSKEISTMLEISNKTVEHHIANVKNKVGCNNITQLITTIKDLGIIN